MAGILQKQLSDILSGVFKRIMLEIDSNSEINQNLDVVIKTQKVEEILRKHLKQDGEYNE